MFNLHVLPKPQQRRTSSDYRHSLESIVKDLAQCVGQRVEIDPLYIKYQLKRRRLYDVINILAAIGCCERTGMDSIIWIGTDGARIKLLQLRETHKIDDHQKSMCDIFSPDYCISLPTLTVAFIMLFPAMNVTEIDLRLASAFLSRDVARHKTTLCKLYQIVLILEIIGVLEKAGQACVVGISKTIFSQPQKSRSVDPIQTLSIEYLLNHKDVADEMTPVYISTRRKEFASYAEKQ